MNELIEKLFSNFIKARFPLDSLTKDDMRIIVELACKAQRNACLRKADEFGINSDYVSKDSIRRNIEYAEITEADYE
jgi:hypothetical protein